MIMRKLRQRQIIEFLAAHPRARFEDIAAAIPSSERPLREALRSLVAGEFVVWCRSGRYCLYSVAQGFDDVGQHAGGDHEREVDTVRQLAEDLESRGLFRRALSVWADLQGLVAPYEVAAIAELRNSCAARARR